MTVRTNVFCLMCVCVMVVLLCCSLWNTEPFRDFTTSQNYNHRVAARVASLQGKHKYYCLTELCKKRARLIHSNQGNLKHVGSESARAIAKAEAQNELENAKQEQNKELTNVSRQNADTYAVITRGKTESVGKYAASTSSEIVDEKIRDIKLRLHNLENKQ